MLDVRTRMAQQGELLITPVRHGARGAGPLLTDLVAPSSRTPACRPAGGGRHPAEQKPRFHPEHVRQLLEHFQLDGGHPAVLEPTDGGPAGARPGSQLGLSEAEGQAQLPESHVDRHAGKRTE